MRTAIILGLLLLAACATIPPDPNMCVQTVDGGGHLDFILAYHNLTEDTSDQYYGRTLEYIASVPPFDEFAYDIYTIPLADDECWTGDADSRLRPVLDCDWDAINDRIRVCDLQSFKLIIVSGNIVQTSTVPTYYQQSITVINERAFDRYNVLHEFGHLFGLQEEYDILRMPINSPARDPRRPNCAANLSQAQEWWGDLVGHEDTGYYPGCAGKAEYIRPNNETLMGNAPHNSTYGYVSTRYLEDALRCCYAADREQQECSTFFDENPDWRLCRE